MHCYLIKLIIINTYIHTKLNKKNQHICYWTLNHIHIISISLTFLKKKKLSS